MPLHNEVMPGSLAARCEGVSGADIKDMILYAALYALEQGKDKLDFSVFGLCLCRCHGTGQGNPLWK